MEVIILQTLLLMAARDGYFEIGGGTTPVVTRGFTGTTNDEFAFLSNPLGLSFLSPSSFYANNSKVNNPIDGSSEFAGYQSSIASDSDYGFKNTDSDILPPYAEIAEVGEAEEASTVAESAEAVAEGSNPVGLALLVNQQLGSAVNDTINQSFEQQITRDQTQNSQAHGLNVALNTQLVRANQQQTLSNQNLGGTIGSLFGPLGALIGHAIAGTVPAQSNFLDTATSFQGNVNPSLDSIVNAQTTEQQSSTSQISDNVD